MKKLFCLLMALVMLCSMCAVSFAETPTTEEKKTFDKSKITGSPLYHYDKFTKKWNIQGNYRKEYRDARVDVSLLLFDYYVTGGYGPELRIDYFDKETQMYDKVTAFRAIVGEKLFSYESLMEGTNAGSAVGGKVMEEFCNALLSGGEVSFQIDHTDKYGSSWTGTIDPVDREDLSDLLTMARLLKNSNAWSICEMPDLWDSVFSATVE